MCIFQLLYVKWALVQALRLCTGRTAHRGGSGIALPFLDHGTRGGVRGQSHAPGALYPREKPGTHCTGDWVGPRAGLDNCGKSRRPPRFDPRTVQHVASRYIDRATRPTNCYTCIYLKKKTKIKIKNTVIDKTLTYVSETWLLRERESK
jgi:hypothetical protein